MFSFNGLTLLEHPRTRRLVDFMWVINGRRMGNGRLRRNLELAAATAGIGHVHPHQLRHTYATTLVNGGMSIEALMAVLGHVTPEMTMEAILEVAPAAQRALFQRYHVGGCNACGFQPEEQRRG